MEEEIKPMFRDGLMVCEEGLLGEAFFVLGGCKLSSNASKEWSGTVRELRWKKERIEKKVKQLVEEQVEFDRREEILRGRGEGKTDRETSEESRASGEVIAREPSEDGEAGERD